MVTDHLSDFVTRIRNGYRAGLPQVEVPSTKAIERVAAVLVKEGYVEKASTAEGVLTVVLKYKGKEPAVINIKRVSKPGVRIYTSIGNMPKVWGGLGINVLSTSKGVISEKEARKMKVGGEIICQVW